jgi:hypothetical protein
MSISQPRTLIFFDRKKDLEETQPQGQWIMKIRISIRARIRVSSKQLLMSYKCITYQMLYPFYLRINGGSNCPAAIIFHLLVDISRQVFFYPSWEDPGALRSSGCILPNSLQPCQSDKVLIK